MTLFVVKLFHIQINGLLMDLSIVVFVRLGGGIFGDTYMAEWTGVKVAVKRITLSVHSYQTEPRNLQPMVKLVAFLRWDCRCCVW